MKEAYLEATFRHGRPLAAYYYLPRREGQKSYKTIRAEAGILVDCARSGRAIGLEITAPAKITLAAINRVLRQYGQATIKPADLAPLQAA